MDGFFPRRRRTFKAALTVQANAGVTVTLSLGGTQVDSQTAGANGIVNFVIKRRGVYTVAHSSSISDEIDIQLNAYTYTMDLVYVPAPAALSAGGFSTGMSYVVWADDAGASGSIVRYSTTAHPISRTDGAEAFGTGSTKAAIAVTSTSTQYGFKQALSSGQTLYWSRWNYVLVNSRYFYSETYATASYAYVNYANKKTYSSGTGTFTIPTGVRSITVFLAGGGGSGSVVASRMSGSTSYVYYGAGGAGGYTTQTSFDVTPGEQLSYSVGNGGAAASGEGASGNAGSPSSVSLGAGRTASANGGGGAVSGGSTSFHVGGSGGSGGGAGGFTKGSGGAVDGGTGGTNGGNGGGNPGYTGNGQGTGTAFDGTTYSPGGRGADLSHQTPGSVTPGTAAGGNGSGYTNTPSGAGASGTVIIKYS